MPAVVRYASSSAAASRSLFPGLSGAAALDGKQADVGRGRVFLIDLRGAKRVRQLAVDIPRPSIAQDPNESKVQSAVYAESLRALLVAQPEVTGFFARR